MGTYKSEVFRVVVLCICELVINWSLFLVINKSNESIYWDRTGRIFNSLNCCHQETFLLKFIIVLIILFCTLNISSLCEDILLPHFSVLYLTKENSVSP